MELRVEVTSKSILEILYTTRSYYSLDFNKEALANHNVEDIIFFRFENYFIFFAEEIETSMRDAALDYRANPEIMDKCPKNLEYCKKETKFDPTISEDGGKIEGLCTLDQWFSTFLFIRGTLPYFFNNLATPLSTIYILVISSQVHNLAALRLRTTALD